MTIGRVDFEQITEADLQSLIDTGVPEGIAIDYKADRYPSNDDGVREFLKDLSSFANTAGGHLIIGMTEEELLHTAFSPLSVNADQEIQRLKTWPVTASLLESPASECRQFRFKTAA